MIELGLSDDFLAGYNDRLKSVPYDKEKPDEWKMGWHNADQKIKLVKSEIGEGK